MPLRGRFVFKKKLNHVQKKMPLLGWFVFKKINKSCSKNAVSRPICLQKSRFGRKKTFATISVVISSSSWLLRAMDPCRLLLDFKNRLFAPSKKTITFKKKLSLQKTRRFARSKKNYQLQKKTRRFAPKRSKKNSKKNSSRFAADFVQKKTPKRSKKNSALRADVQKKTPK